MQKTCWTEVLLLFKSHYW